MLRNMCIYFERSSILNLITISYVRQLVVLPMMHYRISFKVGRNFKFKKKNYNFNSNSLVDDSREFYC